MSIATEQLDRLQQELKYAFKWMARATEYSRQGEFNGSTYAMTVALQHWQNCQHYQDRFVDEDVYNKVDWKFFEKKAMQMAKEELEQEDK